VEVLHQVFRGKFIDGLKQAFTQKRLSFSGLVHYLAEPDSFAEFVREATPTGMGSSIPSLPLVARNKFSAIWGVTPHRVAISNHRLVSFDGDRVTFRWKDYAHGNKERKMTVLAEEFLRRFLLHVLPKGFVRIRHFGFMANAQRAASLELWRKLLDMAPIVHSH
jgi:hypothetical protein